MSFYPANSISETGPRITQLTLAGLTPVIWTVPADTALFVIRPNSADTTMKIDNQTNGFVIEYGERFEIVGRAFAGRQLKFTGTSGATVSILYVLGCT
jgi:hypothetical protein